MPAEDPNADAERRQLLKAVLVAAEAQPGAPVNKHVILALAAMVDTALGLDLDDYSHTVVLGAPRVRAELLTAELNVMVADGSLTAANALPDPVRPSYALGTWSERPAIRLTRSCQLAAALVAWLPLSVPERLELYAWWWRVLCRGNVTARQEQVLIGAKTRRSALAGRTISAAQIEAACSIVKQRVRAWHAASPLIPREETL